MKPDNQRKMRRETLTKPKNKLYMELLTRDLFGM